MDYTKEQFQSIYVDFKRKVLLEDDILMLNSINQDILKSQATTDKAELAQIESRLSSAGYQLAGIVGRLQGYFAIEDLELSKKRIAKEKELIDGGEAMTRASSLAKSELNNEMKDVNLLESVVEEYRGRLFALKEVISSITHKLSRLERNL